MSGQRFDYQPTPDTPIGAKAALSRLVGFLRGMTRDGVAFLFDGPVSTGSLSIVGTQDATVPLKVDSPSTLTAHMAEIGKNGLLYFVIDSAGNIATIGGQAARIQAVVGVPYFPDGLYLAHLFSNTGTSQINADALGFSFSGPVGFNGAASSAKPTITGSRGGNVALANLLTALAAMGQLIDSTT